MEQRKLRWGLLGAGIIIDRWINAVPHVKDMEIAAVASRTPETAAKMAAKHNIPEALTYDEMVRREDIDVVYIPVPHSAHKELALKALKAKKAVLLEKPATVNAAEFEELVQASKENGAFLMEAMWTRFFPLIERINALANDDGIGEIRAIHSSFSFRIPDEALNSRLADPMAAGGGLLDTGVYNLHFAQMLLGPALDITGFAAIDTDHLHLSVDEQAMYTAIHKNGALSMGASGIRTTMDDTAYIYGTKGRCIVPRFWKPTRMQVIIGNEPPYTVEEPVPCLVEGIEDEGFQYELIHVNECVRKGLTESPVMTFEDSLSVLRLCDKLRSSWGLRYPFE